MKTFKQFREGYMGPAVNPKHYEPKDTIIRTTDVKTKSAEKFKKGSKDAKRRKSYCARSAGQMKKFPKAAKDPNSRLRQARRRWKC